jgi:hypothetical protein
MKDEDGAAKSVFPGQASKIDRLIRRDEVFADLCRDFDLAVSEHRIWTTSDAPERDERLAEYAMLMQELKAEIARAIETADVVRLRIDNLGRR